MIYHNRRKAAALRYNQEQEYAPKVSASEQDYIADTIIEKSKKNNVIIMEDSFICEILAEIKNDETITDELYEAVAEVIAFVNRVDHPIGSVNKTKNIDT